jgi:hypothetical protein
MSYIFVLRVLVLSVLLVLRVLVLSVLLVLSALLVLSVLLVLHTSVLGFLPGMRSAGASLALYICPLMRVYRSLFNVLLICL